MVSAKNGTHVSRNPLQRPSRPVHALLLCPAQLVETSDAETMSPGVATMLDVLDEPLLRLIFHKLTAWEAARASCVCRAWRAWITADADGWRSRFCHTFYDASRLLTHGREAAHAWEDDLNAQRAQYSEFRAFTPTLYSSPIALASGSLSVMSGFLPAGISSVCTMWKTMHAFASAGGNMPALLRGPYGEFQDSFPAEAQDVVVFNVRPRWPMPPTPPTEMDVAQAEETGMEPPRMKAFMQYVGQLFNSLGDLQSACFKWLDAAHKPFVVCPWVENAALIVRHPDAPPPNLREDRSLEHRVVVDLPPRGDPRAWWKLYNTAASKAFNGGKRCVVCHAHVNPGQTHPVLHAPMCKAPSCRQAYPYVKLHDVLPGLPGPAAALITKLQVRKAKSTYRSSKPRQVRIALKSTVEACMMAKGGYGCTCTVLPSGRPPPAPAPAAHAGAEPAAVADVAADGGRFDDAD